MKQVFFFLILIMLGMACSAQQKTKHRKIMVTVLDKNTDLPVDSATVIMSMMVVDARDEVSNVKYADKYGRCSFSIDANPLASGRVGAFKKGLIGYFDDNYIDLDRSFANVNKTDKNIVLYLTSDSLNHISYWKKITIRYDIDTLISLLKSNKYPDRSAFPSLFWEDIPKLLTIGNNSTLINNFPRSVISSGSMYECYLGIISLWFIESTRITVLKKAFEPLEKFPSQSHGLLDKSKPGSRQNNIETMDKAYQAYKAWWEKVKNMDKEQGCKINPLENTGLEW